MTPAAPLPGPSPRVVRSTLGERLRQRPRRPPLVWLYAVVLSDLGVLGRPARRRALRLVLRSLGPAVMVLCAALLALGAFAADEPGLGQAGALLALALALAGAIWRRTLGAAEGRAAGTREQLELGSLFVVAAYAMAQAAGSGGAESPLQPLVYLVMAFLVAFLDRPVGFALVGLAASLELLSWLARGARGPDLPATLVHGGFVALFAVLYHAVLASHVAAGRRAERDAVGRRLREIEERARALRLCSPGDEPVAEDSHWTAAAVVEVEAAVSGALEVVEAALRCQSCAVYRLSEDERELRLLECRSAADSLSPGPLPAGEGALGAALKTRRPVRLHGELRGPAHHRDGVLPGALLAVPLVDARGGHVRGVVVADRAGPEPFSEGDERVLLALAAEILRAATAERLMADLRRARDEKKRFLDALERLNRITKPVEVFDTTLEVARGLAGADVAVLTLHETRGARRTHKVVRAQGDEELVKAVDGHAWADEAGGLVASAVRLDSSLPGKELDVSRTPVFDPETRWKGVGSLRVLPLRSAQQVLGTLVVGSRSPRAFGSDLTRQLEVVAMQAAASILRARLFDATELLATTDGLTGLLNHRTFQARLDEQLALAHRYGKRAALLLCDIDHFKAVNDTYGHPVGDVVLRGVARILAREARTTDLAARHGGEEFAVLMPETDAAGALVIAERIRERVAAQVFESDQGPLRVTLSLGVAGYPDHADRRAALLQRADACLYQAKRSGRNRSVAASSPARAGPAAAG